MRLSGYRILLGICGAIFVGWRMISPISGPMPLVGLVVTKDYWMMVVLGCVLTGALIIADLITTKGEEEDRNILSTTADALALVVVAYIVFFTGG